VSGRVAYVFRRVGEVVAGAEPILSIVSAHGRVVACVPEEEALHVGVGDRAKLWVEGSSGAPLHGTTVALAPIVTEVSVRCRRIPTIPAWGREVTIQVDHPVELVPGQAFNIELDHTNAPPAPAPTAAPAAAPLADAPILMKVPGATRALSRIEPSGIVYRQDLKRYVFVSDDTGHEDKDEHTPWLFAMDERGAVDADPIVIEGIKKVTDLESITAGDAGEVYVLSAQGYSKNGKRSKARTALLRLTANGRGFRVDGEVHLAELLDAAGGDLLTRLGLPQGTRQLEIEGMTFHRGALYFGLKSPLDPKGDALVWKLNDPKALFAGGDLNSSGLSLWARARLDAEVDGRTVAGGISELLFLPDGSLVMASTASNEQGATESGRVWYVPSPAEGRLTPRLVKTFPGLKPEGLCLSATPGKMLVVFDAGAATPSFLELPWPR
jgi:hypothetical protein